MANKNTNCNCLSIIFIAISIGLLVGFLRPHHSKHNSSTATATTTITTITMSSSSLTPTSTILLSTTSTSTAAPTATSSASATSPRILYDHLDSACVQSCIKDSISQVAPLCKPFTADCVCPLPSGRIAYELPIECAQRKCSNGDVVTVKGWWEGVCGSNSSSSENNTSPSQPMSNDCGTHCEEAFFGGCCPSDYTCNLLDCQPPVSSTSPSLSASSSSSSPTPSQYANLSAPINPSSFFPACSHACIGPYLLQTQCSSTPLNRTCLCRLHDFYSCFAPSISSNSDGDSSSSTSGCDNETTAAFMEQHKSLCNASWYMTPWDSETWRWCDVLRVPGSDVGKVACPNWWYKRDAGQRFGIVFGMFVATLLFILLW